MIQKTESIQYGKNGKIKNFDRWQYSKWRTVVEKLKELYQFPIYRENFLRSDYFEIWKTDASGNQIELLKTVSGMVIDGDKSGFYKAD